MTSILDQLDRASRYLVWFDSDHDEPSWFASRLRAEDPAPADSPLEFITQALVLEPALALDEPVEHLTSAELDDAEHLDVAASVRLASIAADASHAARTRAEVLLALFWATAVDLGITPDDFRLGGDLPRLLLDTCVAVERRRAPRGDDS